MFVKLVT